MKCLFFVFLFFCSTHLMGAESQDVPKVQSTPQPKESFFKQFALDFISPVTTPARWNFLAGSAITTVFWIQKENEQDTTEVDASNDKPLGRFSIVGDMAGQLAPNLIYYIYQQYRKHYFDGSNQDGVKKVAARRADLMFRSTLHSGLLTTILKYTVKEPRPNGGANVSFPSGHTTTAFTFATTVAIEHKWYYGVAAYGLAGFVGYSRMNDHKHFTHDVIAGATIGISYAAGIYFRQEETKEYAWTIYPTYEQQTLALRTTIEF